MTSQIKSAESASSPSVLISLFPEYQARARRYAYWFLGNRNDSEEVVQEAFVRLAQREQNGKPIADENGFAGLLFTTVRNLSIDVLRKGKRTQNVELTSDRMPLVRESDDMVSSEFQDELTKQLRELPEQWAEALKLRTSAELSYDEIAKVLGCTRAQVRTWIYRARKRLAENLKRLGWP